jgi:hypothetical protein
MFGGGGGEPLCAELQVSSDAEEARNPPQCRLLPITYYLLPIPLLTTKQAMAIDGQAFNRSLVIIVWKRKGRGYVGCDMWTRDWMEVGNDILTWSIQSCLEFVMLENASSYSSMFRELYEPCSLLIEK